MKKATTAITSAFLSLALICSDTAIAAEAASSVAAAGQKDEGQPDQQAGSPQRGEIRRPSNALCAGVGIVVGLIAGALLGRSRRNGGDGFSGTAAAIGGVGSALICRAVRWRSVAREDQEDVNRRVGSMTLDPNANVQTYRSPATGKTYTITAGETTYRNNNTEFTTLADVDSPRQGYKITVTPYVVTAAVLNLRSTPGTETSDRVTGAFYQNDFIESLAETPDGQWVLVGFDGVGYGWVSRRYLVPATIAFERITFARPAPPPAPGAVAIAAVAPPRRTTRRGRGARRAPVARGPIQVARMTTVPPTRTQRVRAQMACRNFTVAEGQRSDSNRSCAGPRGAVLMG
jgi:hypothetical protein